MSFALIDGFKVVFVVVIFFFFFAVSKAKHVFSCSHGNSLGFHANWQVCFCVCFFLFFSVSFQPDIFPFHFIRLFVCLFFLALLFTFIIVACVCVFVCAHTRFAKIVPDFTLCLADIYLLFAKVKTKI